MHKLSSYVTLTYADEHLFSPSLQYRDFKNFTRRVRREFGPFRFFMCGEYGDQDFRPHFHALLFGVHFGDRQFFTTRGKSTLFRSPTLERLWPFGYSTIGDVSYESASYVARYICKKVTGGLSEDHYKRVDIRTGEVVELRPEFCVMSRRPGVGKPWFDKFHGDVFPRDFVIARGSKSRPPRAYKKWLDQMDPDMGEGVDFDRFQIATALTERPQPSLSSMEAVAQAGLAQRKRLL